MDAKELTKLLEAGDLFELAVRVNRALLAKHYPGMEYAVLMGVTGAGRPDLMLPILTPVSASSGPRSGPSSSAR